MGCQLDDLRVIGKQEDSQFKRQDSRDGKSAAVSIKGLRICLPLLDLSIPLFVLVFPPSHLLFRRTQDNIFSNPHWLYVFRLPGSHLWRTFDQGFKPSRLAPTPLTTDTVPLKTDLGERCCC